MDVVSPYLTAIVVGWMASQGAKYVVAAIKTKSLKVFDRLYLSGNMPSAHSATVMSVTTVILLRDGVNSGVFGLAAATSLIILYDAMMVRRSVGEQGEALRKLIQTSETEVKQPRVAKGHTPLEVLVGVLVGICAGVVVFYATK